MLKSPRVSVILPTFNDLDYLKIAIRSALAQNYHDYELIVVDDGSDDGTREYLATLKNSRLFVFSKENGGAFDAINYGIERARGELVTWVSSDNWCPNYFLEALVSGIDSYPEAKFAYASYFNIDAYGKVFGVNLANHQFPNEMLTSSHRGNAAFIYYKDCHSIVGPYIESHSCDTDMWIKLTSSFDEKVVYIIEPIYFYRFHEKRITSNLPKNHMADTLDTLFKSFQKLHKNQNILNKIFPRITGSQDPYCVAMACNDIAIRYTNQGLLGSALMFWVAGMSVANKPALRALIHNLAEAFAKHKLESPKMLEQMKLALEENARITDKDAYLGRALQTYNEAKEEGFCGFITDGQILLTEYKNRFVCFSYHAWKAGVCQTSVMPTLSVTP